MLTLKYKRMFHAVKDVIHIRTLRLQKEGLNVLLQKEFTRSDSLPQVFLEM